MSATAVLAGGELRYSAVWEDHRLIERGIGVRRGSEVLMIASAGCNVLNMLRLEPHRITAIDVNPAQTAMLELKLAGFRRLSHAELLALIGVRESGARLELYERVRPLLSEAARDWWDANLPTLLSGAERAGRLDRFFADFRRDHLAAPERRRAAERLFALPTLAAQAAHAEAELFTPDFEAGFRAHFTRESLGGRGRDPSQFAFVEDDDVPEWFLGRLRWACTALPAGGNHYLQRFLLGAPRDVTAGPPYLRRASFDRIRALASRVSIVTDTLDAHLERVASRSLDGAALSDVFEYLSPEHSAGLFAELSRVLRPGGRVAYWNLLVSRRSPEGLRGLRHLGARSRDLWRHDRAWFYRSFNVEEAVA